MKRCLWFLTATLSTLAAPGLAQAQDSSPLSFNIGAVTDYRFRGISQTRLQPAIQGGADFAAPNGFYLGTWLSNIKWIKDTPGAGSANVEWDVYGGYKGEIAKDVGFDVGALGYIYPGNHYDDVSGEKADTVELYGALTFGPATVKYSHAVTTLFGFPDSENSYYFEGAATFDVGWGLSLTPHVGYQHIAHNSDFNYTDYSLTLSKDFSGFVVSLAAVGTDTKKLDGINAYASPANGKNLGRATAVLGIKKTF
jgi:uncharacterized protein (TIGR02001 family)